MEPEYYNVVTNPIDLLKIQHKLKSDEYSSVDLLTADVELMVNNAKAYYKVRPFSVFGLGSFASSNSARVENQPCLVASWIHLDHDIVTTTHFICRRLRLGV